MKRVVGVRIAEHVARLSDVAPRALRLLGGHASPGTAAVEHGGTGTLVPPNESDARLIAGCIRSVAATTPPSSVAIAGRDLSIEADAIAADLVRRANSVLAGLVSESDAGLSDADAVALESVLMARGRPALRVQGDRLEPLSAERHPQSGFWRALLDDHEDTLATVAAATAAVVVRDGSQQRVVGTAWLIKRDLAVTNRHVLFPPPGGRPLAMRGTDCVTTATPSTDLDAALEFALDDGPRRSVAYRIIDIPLVARADDAVDVAVLHVEPCSSNEAVKVAPLALGGTLSAGAPLYVVGHPGPLLNTSDAEQAVFGDPDGRKRVSLGNLMEPHPARPLELVHDASTIGGYSGGCVVDFFAPNVVGLHYYGDSTRGNRAVSASSLRSYAGAKLQ